jgi:transglutaminase-like putative cysteine protease
MSRPVGVSAGAIGLALAWIGGATIARLTGATPVVIVLAAGLVLSVAAVLAAPLALRSIKVGRVQMPPIVSQGERFTLSLELDAPRPVWVEIATDGHVVSSGWAADGSFVGEGVMERRGATETLDIGVRSAGVIGLVWWARRFEVPVDEPIVAARLRRSDVVVERSVPAMHGDRPGPAGAIAGEIDGVRPWREGDSEKFVHWASTVRAGELVVHDRRGDAAEALVVRARVGTTDPDGEAGAVRSALEQGLNSGAQVGVAVGDGEAIPIGDISAVARWSAFADLGATPPTVRPRTWFRWSPEPETTASLTARWWAAAATFVSLAMLSSALGYGAVLIALTGLGTIAGALVSARSVVSGEPPSRLTRVFVGAGAFSALIAVVAASGQLGDLVGFLRGPLAQILIVLIVLHGFECNDRRTIRVGLGISSIVVMYASGFRVDDGIGWWLVVWATCFGIALARLADPTVSGRSPARSALARLDLARLIPRAAALGGGVAATVAVLIAVPVPTGPANLTLPTLISDADDVAVPGAVAGPGGELRDGGDTPELGEPSRAPAGQAGGYTGFAAEMDTSARGDLGDEVVMRVRAPEPDFWRGQTFARFDGRTWYADEQVGVRRSGPNVDIPSAVGEIQLAAGVDVEQFVQTYYLEVDMSNLVFHANRPVQVVIDSDLWTRPDGAIRASTVLPEGSIYTVISARPTVDEELLARQGLIGTRLTELGRRTLAAYLELPPSTSPETIALANQLAGGETSTYGVVRAYEHWMTENVEYDLGAPLPDAGEDAVHDFLFDTQLGFCEQIASSLTIMLRTQGVPARLVTGYLPGSRDRIAGVFEVKASDAHAWVEVWFPETGWQAFDPTAAVPLSADAGIDSIGSDLVEGSATWVGEHRVEILTAVMIGLLVVAGVSMIREIRYRRRRGRWGLLQDRFSGAAEQLGMPPGAPNPRLALAWTDVDDAAVARLVAERLDRAAFDDRFVDDGSLFDDTRKLVGSLPRRPR